MKGLLLVFVFVPMLAFAKPADLTKMKDYKAKNPSYDKEMSCKACHPKGKELNEYGKKYQDAKGDIAAIK